MGENIWMSESERLQICISKRLKEIVEGAVAEYRLKSFRSCSMVPPERLDRISEEKGATEK